jgi:hypothetical protein
MAPRPSVRAERAASNDTMPDRGRAVTPGTRSSPAGQRGPRRGRGPHGRARLRVAPGSGARPRGRPPRNRVSDRSSTRGASSATTSRGTRREDAPAGAGASPMLGVVRAIGRAEDRSQSAAAVMVGGPCASPGVDRPDDCQVDSPRSSAPPLRSRSSESLPPDTLPGSSPPRAGKYEVNEGAQAV